VNSEPLLCGVVIRIGPQPDHSSPRPLRNEGEHRSNHPPARLDLRFSQRGAFSPVVGPGSPRGPFPFSATVTNHEESDETERSHGTDPERTTCHVRPPAVRGGTRSS